VLRVASALVVGWVAAAVAHSAAVARSVEVMVQSDEAQSGHPTGYAHHILPMGNSTHFPDPVLPRRGHLRAPRRATAPALFSVGLMDPICPPSTVCAAYNHYGASTGSTNKTIEVYEFNEHEGGAGHQFTRQLPWLAALAEGNGVS